MEKQKPKLILFGDPKRPNAREAQERFLKFATGKAEILYNCFDEECPQELLQKADYAIVFGGDGTILSAAHKFCEMEVPVMGVNVGKLGYLAEFSVEELIWYFDQLVGGAAAIENRMVLDCRLVREQKTVFSTIAVNDVVITAGEPFRMIEVEISVRKQKLAGCVGDGVIVSTPTGSTAYNLSAGGPILSANIEAMVITPICAHSLSFRPIVINCSNEVQIRPTRVNDNTMLVVDGQLQGPLRKDDCVEVVRSKVQFRIVNNPMRTQWDTLAEKLNWGEKLKYNS